MRVHAAATIVATTLALTFCAHAATPGTAAMPAATTSRPAATTAVATRPSATSSSQPAASIKYAAIFMEGRKVGYISTSRATVAGDVTTSTFMEIAIKRGDVALVISVAERDVETIDGQPLAFEVVQTMGQMSTKTEGRIDPSGKVKVRITSAGRTREQEMDWPRGALLQEGLRRLCLSKGFSQCATFSEKVFDASSLKAIEANVTVGGKTDVDLLGRVVPLVQVTTEMFAPSGRVAMTTYLNESGDALKTNADVMGMKMEMLACDKLFAMSPNDGLDFFDKLLLPSPTPLKDLAKAKEVRYTLARTGKEPLKFINTDEQTAAAGDGDTNILTVRPIRDAKGDKFPYAGDDPAAKAALKPTRYLESDDERVAALSKEAVGDAKDSLEAAKRIEAFVAKYISKKDLSVGYASAAEVARSRQGDCTEHAVLVAAMCRSAGIPAQVVSGLAYVPEFGGKKDVFGPHAWARAFVGGKWISLDAALGGFDGGHIAIGCGDGESSDFFGVINTLGNFKIVEAQAK
jgi:hypothetical protein